MSKKVKFQGKKLKNQSDPKLAHSHPKGAQIYFAQPAVDPRWGRYHFLQYKRCFTVLNKCGNYYDETIQLLEQSRSLQLNEKTGIRTLPDDLKEKLEIASMQFVILNKLGYEYLYAEYITGVKQIKEHKHEEFTVPSDIEDLTKRLRVLMEAIEFTEKIPQELHTLFSRRDVVEHPTLDRLWDATDSGWKNVHLSWVLSGEIEGIMDKLIPFTQKFIDRLEKYLADNPIQGTIRGLTRGLKAGEQYKKPAS